MAYTHLVPEDLESLVEPLPPKAAPALEIMA